MYKGTILQYLKKYIKDLQADQLESYILSGECTLHSFELEPSAISDWVSDVFPYTAEVEKVFCSKASIKIPWAQIRTKPLVISIQEMEMVVHVHDFREQEWNMHMASLQKDLIISNKISDLEDIANVPDFTKYLKQFELGWTDFVSAGMQIRIEFCRIVFKSKSVTRIPSSLPSPVLVDPIPAYICLVEGLFLAPCHDSDNGSITYVDTPDRVYQHDTIKSALRLSRLITLKSLQVSANEKVILTHSPGFRFRVSSNYTCAQLGKNKFSVPPFASGSDSELWIDKLDVRNLDLFGPFYALLQDLACPVIVPPEALTEANRFVHFAFRENEIIEAKSEAELAALRDLMREPSEIPPPPISYEASLPRKNITQNNVSLKKLFLGLAREVNKVSETAHHKTDAIVTQSKKFLKSIGRRKPRKSVIVPHVENSPNIADEDSSSSSEHYNSSTGSFLDVIEDTNHVASVYQSEEEPQPSLVSEGSVFGFGLEKSCSVLLDKICFQSKFHFHLNELFIFSDIHLEFGQIDFKSISDTPLAFSQLCTLAGFCSSPENFVNQAKKITANILCSRDPVSAHSWLSIGRAKVRKCIHGGPLSLSWKSRTVTPMRTRKNHVQPIEGNICNFVAELGSRELLVNFFSQITAAAGAYPGAELDPEVQLKLSFSNIEIVAPNALRILVPNGSIVQNFAIPMDQKLVSSSPQSHTYVQVPLTEYTELVGAKLETVEQEVLIDSLRDQISNLSEDLVRKNALLKTESFSDTEPEIVAEKICALEACLKEISQEIARVDRAASELRRTCADELVASRAELLMEKSTWEMELDEKTKEIAALQAEISTQEHLIEGLKRHREFLLGVVQL